MPPAISVILVNYNERSHLERVIKLLTAEFLGIDHEIIVVDNASTDGSAATVKASWPNVILLEPGQNLMYGKGNNLGMKRARGGWLLIINVDVDWTGGQLKKLYSLAQTKTNLGLAGPQLRYPDGPVNELGTNGAGRIQISAHKNFPSAWSVFVDYCLPLQQLLMRFGGHPYQESISAHEQTHRVAHLTGVCLLLPRQTYEKIGGFDEKFTMYLEETEWQKRMAVAGLDRWFFAETSIIHYGSAAKTFAQASRHFLSGLEQYTLLHWSGIFKHGRLWLAIGLATIISDVFLLLLWLPSWLLGAAGRRLRYYGKQYFLLSRSILFFRLDTNA